MAARFLGIRTAFCSTLPTLTLRPYQKECITRSIELFKKNLIRSQIVSLPVGSGKTVIISHLIQQIPQKHLLSSKVLILGHRRELLFQTKKQIISLFPSLTVSIEAAGVDRSNDHTFSDVIVASVHSLGRPGGKERLFSFDPSSFKAIIIDEAHHSAAPIYRRIIEYFEGLNKEILIWGCSSTITREDGKSLSSIYQHVTYHLPIPKLIEDGTLCRPVIKSFEQSTPPCPSTIAKGWMDNIFKTSTKKSTLIFALNIEQCHLIKKALLSLEGSPIAEKDIGILTSKTEKTERLRMLDLFSKGKLKIIINCAILTEGVDIPRTDSIILQRPSCGDNLFLQIIGRGLRKWGPDKKDCLILDYSSRKRSLLVPALLSTKHLEVPDDPGYGFRWIRIFKGDLFLLGNHVDDVSVFVIPTTKVSLVVYLRIVGNRMSRMFGFIGNNGTNGSGKVSHKEWIPFPALIREIYTYAIKRDILVEMKSLSFKKEDACLRRPTILSATLVQKDIILGNRNGTSKKTVKSLLSSSSSSSS